jgi:predicted metal-dependent peptidase
VIFQHGSRRSNRDAVRWNIACDHAINLLLLEQGFVLPAGGLADRRFLRKSAEIIYGLLPNNISYKKRLDGLAADIGLEGDGVLSDAGLDLFDPDDVRTRAMHDVDAPDQSQLRELCEALRNDAKSKLHGVGIEAPGHIVFAVDTSGSMADEQLARLFSEVRAYRETFPCQLTVIQADAAIQSVTTYDEMDGIEIPPNVTVVGRGGTDFRPVFRWIEENAPGANLIYATDGFGTFPQVSSGGAVIWLLCRPHIEFDQVPFGVCVGLPN